MVTVFLYGVAFYGTSSMTYFIACKYIGSGLSMVIFFAYPAIVMAFNVLLYKAKIKKTFYFAVIILITGMLLLVDLHEIQLDALGIMLSVLSAVFYACYMVAVKHSTVQPLLSTFMVLTGCTVSCLVVAYFDHSLMFPSQLQQWLNIFGISIISTVIPILLLLKAMEYITSEKASMLSVLEPILVVIFGITLLNESVTALQIFGATIVLSGALITLFSSSRRD